MDGALESGHIMVYGRVDGATGAINFNEEGVGPILSYEYTGDYIRRANGKIIPHGYGTLTQFEGYRSIYDDIPNIVCGVDEGFFDNGRFIRTAPPGLAPQRILPPPPRPSLVVPAMNKDRIGGNSSGSITPVANSTREHGPVRPLPVPLAVPQSNSTIKDRGDFRRRGDRGRRRYVHP